MDPMELLRQIGLFALATLLIDTVPLMAAAIYAARPTEARLALMRPFSLAAIFAGIAGTLSGFTHVLQGIAVTGDLAVGWGAVSAGLAEALVTTVFGFTCLTVAWLLVAIGMWRGVREGTTVR